MPFPLFFSCTCSTKEDTSRCQTQKKHIQYHQNMYFFKP
jgi:hypothetical protein